MATDIRRRIQRLEQRLAQARINGKISADVNGDRDRQRAIATLFDVLEAHYPDNGYERSEDGRIARRGFGCMALQASQRLLAGSPSDRDREATAALPKEELRRLGWTATEALILIGSMYDPTMTLSRWREIGGPRSDRDDISDEELDRRLGALGLGFKADPLSAS